MESLTLVLRNLMRNRRRSFLSLAGVAVSIFVYVGLTAVTAGITAPLRQNARERLLGVREKARTNVMASQLPASMEATVAGLPGVAVSSGVLSALSLVGEERVHVFVHGVDPGSYRKARDFRVEDAQWQAFAGERNSAVLGGLLAQQLKWTVGQTVELQDMGLTVTLRAVLPSQDSELDRQLLVHRDYLQSVRHKDGLLTALLVRPDPAAGEDAVAAAIDRRFADSETPTATVSQSAYAGALIEEYMGFVHYLDVIGIITLLVTLLGAVNAFSMSVRERIREIGLLRTLGFTPARVVSLVVAESLVVALLGGLVGVGLAAAAVGSRPSMPAVQWVTYLSGVAAALVVGVLGGVLPALGAVRLSVVDALRVVD